MSCARHEQISRPPQGRSSQAPQKWVHKSPVGRVPALATRRPRADAAQPRVLGGTYRRALGTGRHPTPSTTIRWRSGRHHPTVRHSPTQPPAVVQPSPGQTTNIADPAGSGRRLDLARLISGAILAGLGGAVAHTVLDGSYTAYVRPFMRIPLGLAALILIVAGLAGCVSGFRPTNGTPASDEHGDHHADGSGIPGAALIALVPLAVLAILRPPALDDAAADSVAPAASQTQQDAGIQVRPLPGDPTSPRRSASTNSPSGANAGMGRQLCAGARCPSKGSSRRTRTACRPDSSASAAT